MKVYAVPFTDRVGVLRRQGRAAIVCPCVTRRDDWLEQMSTRLHPDELESVRAGFGVGDLDDLRRSLPDDVCPCWWPAALRPPDAPTWCAVHNP